MQPTTKDLAKAAGVSLATVDRVLNDRANVSEKASTKVREAIERIGFVRNLAAVNLVKNKTYKFRFIVPEVGDQYLQEIIQQVEDSHQAVKQDMTRIDVVQIPMSDPHTVANYLTNLGTDEIDGLAIMAPESPQVRDAMSRLSERGIKIVQFLSGQDRLDDLDFVGVDNFAAGATAGRIIGGFLSGKTGSIMVIAETMQSLDSIQRRLGFSEVLHAKYPNLTALPSLETHGDEGRTQDIITRAFQHHDDILAVYVVSAEARTPMSKVALNCELENIVTVVHERTPFTEQSLKDEKIDAVIAQNPGHAVRSATRILRARMENREPLAGQEKIRIEILVKENL